ncbi:MAG TPA: hypothetical protein VGX48_22380 [Pyrinomonadaceae bacterium]|jgi:hypothetical protein|nr:hypothetical protein [Pyrinomonadaceae bacterium]
MQKTLKSLTQMATGVAFVLLLSVVASAQVSTSGQVNLSGTVSKFVELNSGGAVTLTGNSGGGVSTDGVAGDPLLVTVALGELGPANSNSFVKLSVPLKIRSNTNYVLSMSATVASGTSSNRMLASDIGFGIGAVTRSTSVVGLHTGGSDVDNTSGDPTGASNGAVNSTSGKFEYTAARSHLGAFSSSTTVLSGSRVLNAVPRTNTNGLVFPAIFSVKPQFYDEGAMTATATFTIAAP